ncbi:TPA: inverse autotransporter beta domain-containing protein, partial [Morganella morganii]|nr:inverse autotransporter beta domain-containing protein [Morganella morganii]
MDSGKERQFSFASRITAYLLVFTQVFFPVSVAFAGVARAAGPQDTETEMVNTLNGISALMNGPVSAGDSPPVPSANNILPSRNLSLPQQNTTLTVPAQTPENMPLPDNMFSALSAHDLSPAKTGRLSAAGAPSPSPENDGTVPQDDIFSGLPSLGTPETENNTQTPDAAGAARYASQAGQILSDSHTLDASLNYVRSIGQSLINQQINDWLNQYGRARVQLGTDKTADADFLLPLADNPDSLLFTQFGLRTKNERNTVNVGIGHRQYTDDWMWGVNSFYDYDITGGNSRAGVGAELWMNYLKLAANGYFRLTDWHQSPLQAMRDYDERPANGFDIRAEGYLPRYPQLGMSLKHERYFGEGVSLDSSTSVSSLKSSPARTTLGVSYTPFPLITLRGDMARGDAADNRIGLEMNYRLGVSLDDQLDPGKVDLMRNLAGSRYDFVDRNYDIVMQYRKQDLIVISLPAAMTAEAAETRAVTLTVNKAKYGVKSVDWSAPDLIAAGGTVTAGRSPDTVSITLPAYNWDGVTGSTPPAQQYSLSATAEDNEGNRSNTAVMRINVNPSQEKVASVEMDMTTIRLADNLESYEAVATLRNEKGEGLADREVIFEVSGFRNNKEVTLERVAGGSRSAAASGDESGAGYLKTVSGSAGDVTVRIRSKVAGQGRLKVSMNNGNSLSRALTFKADSSTARLSDLVLTRDGAVADGTAENRAEAVVQDQYGNPVDGFALSASASGDAVVTRPDQTTDTDGKAVFGFTSTTAGRSVLTVTGAGTQKTADAVFIGDVSTAVIKSAEVVSDNAKADGSDTNRADIVVEDRHGNRVAGAPVTVTVPSGAKYSTEPAKNLTDADGKLAVSITNTRAGTDNYTFGINQSTAQVALTFKPDAATAALSADDLTVVTDNSVADGTAQNSVKALVKDAQGNPVPDIKVVFAADNGATPPSQTVTSGTDGSAVFAVKNTTAGQTTVSAYLQSRGSGTAVSRSVTFTAGKPVSAKSILSTDSGSYTAGGEMTVSAALKDAQGNAVSGEADLLNDSDAVLNVPGAERKKGSVWTESGTEGIYQVIYTAVTAGDGLTASVILAGWESAAESPAY